MDDIKSNKATLEAAIDEIPHEFVVQEKLRNERKEIKSFDELIAYLKNVEDNYGYGYGVAPRAIAQACLAVGWYLSSSFGITGFQAGCVTWDFILDWQLIGNKCGAKLVDYDKMLFPQYDYQFSKTISNDVWEKLQDEAKKLLEENDYAHPDVVAHWKSIASGIVPFGYNVKD